MGLDRQVIMSLAVTCVALAASCSADGSSGGGQCTPAPSDLVASLNGGAESGATIGEAFIEEGGPYDPGFGQGYTHYSYLAASVGGDVAVWAVTYQGEEAAVVLPMNDHARQVNITGRDVTPGAPIYTGIGGESDAAYGRVVACASGG